MVVRGQNRKLEGAVIGFGLRFLDALAKGKPHSWAYGLVGAVEQGSAQSHHYLRARAVASRANERVADTTVEALDSIIPLLQRLAEQKRQPRRFIPSEYSTTPAPQPPVDVMGILAGNYTGTGRLLPPTK